LEHCSWLRNSSKRSTPSRSVRRFCKLFAQSNAGGRPRSDDDDDEVDDESLRFDGEPERDVRDDSAALRSAERSVGSDWEGGTWEAGIDAGGTAFDSSNPLKSCFFFHGSNGGGGGGGDARPPAALTPPSKHGGVVSSPAETNRY
jgi:hypothetical protein